MYLHGDEPFPAGMAGYEVEIIDFPPSRGTLINCTISDNSCDGSGGGIYSDYTYLELSNCLLWGNRAGQAQMQEQLAYVFLGETPTINYNCIQGGMDSLTGTGNIDVDPMFVDPGYWNDHGTPTDPNDDFWVDGDYRLQAGSPCIDAGDPNYVGVPDETDIDGNVRIVGGRIDIGAYEYAVNAAPVADAGSDVAVYTAADGTAGVELDGSGSSDADGDDLSYVWSWEAGGHGFTADGVSPVIELPAGEHVIGLVVSDGVEESETDFVVVTVIGAVESKMFFVPQAINRLGEGKFVMGIMDLPEAVEKGDVDDGSFVLYIDGDRPNSVVPVMVRIYANRHLRRIFVVFDRADFVEALPADDGWVEVGIEAALDDGRYLYGSDMVRIVTPRRRQPNKPPKRSSRRGAR